MLARLCTSQRRRASAQPRLLEVEWTRGPRASAPGLQTCRVVRGRGGAAQRRRRVARRSGLLGPATTSSPAALPTR